MGNQVNKKVIIMKQQSTLRYLTILSIIFASILGCDKKEDIYPVENEAPAESTTKSDESLHSTKEQDVPAKDPAYSEPNQFISTLEDRTGTMALYQQKGDDKKMFALVEIKGHIEWNASGITKGEENFLRLQTADNPDKWLPITKRKLVNGKLIVITEDDKEFTIYDIQADFKGKIAIGTISDSVNVSDSNAVPKTVDVQRVKNKLSQGVSSKSNVNNLQGMLAEEIYVDPKGFFWIVPPKGWDVEDYSDDPRGKVAFISPDKTTDLRILVNSVEFSTIEELISWCKDFEKKVGTNSHIKKIDFNGYPAVERMFEKNGLKISMIDFLIGKIDHNLMFSTPLGNYEKFRKLVFTSMETYEPLTKNLESTQNIKLRIAKNIRLS